MAFLTMDTNTNRGPEALDELDRRIVAGLQSNPRAAWGQIARVLGTSESTVARRAQRMIDARFIRIVGAADPVRCNFGTPVIVQLECEMGALSAVARTLAQRPDVRFTTLVAGTFDVVAELVVPSRRHLATIILESFGEIKGIRKTKTDNVLRNFKTSYGWSDYLSIDEENQLAPQGVDGTIERALDDVDLRILQLLGDDGRCPWSDLARPLGLTESTVRRRVDALRKGGYLRFAIFVDPELMDYEVELIMWLHVDISKFEDVAKALKARREIRYLSATSGYSDLFGEVVLRRQENIYPFVTEVLGAIPGIRQTEIGIELECLKRGYLLFSNPIVRNPPAVTPAQS